MARPASKAVQDRQSSVMGRLWWIALALVACLGAGCVSAPTAGKRGSGSDSTTTKLRVVNELSNYNIHSVHMSLSTSDSWDDDRLDDNQILRPGQTESWSIDPGEWDIRCIDEDVDNYTRMRVCVERGMTVEWRVRLTDLDD